jgi:hypothetical protein
MIRRDPIVEEVRKHRAQIACEHGNVVEAMVEALEGEDPSETTPIVSFPSKRLPKRTIPKRLRRTRRPNKALEPTREADADAPRLNADVGLTNDERTSTPR